MPTSPFGGRGQKPDASQLGMPLSIEVEDGEEVQGRALSRGPAIVDPLTDEAWGMRRLHVSDPDGIIYNMRAHLE